MPNRSQPGFTCETIAVPTTMPGISPMTIGRTRRQTAPNASRLFHNTYAFNTTSISTRPG